MNTLAQKASKSPPSTSDDIAKVFLVRFSILDRYRSKEIYVGADQIVDPNNPFRNIDESHCHS